MPLVVAVAKSQVGVHEGYAEGGWNNLTRYAAEVPTLSSFDGQSWCDIFISWVAMRAGVASLFPRTADCSASITWWQAASRWSWYPAVGAQVMLGPSGTDHTGLVYAYDATWIYTVEGNGNVNGTDEGDGVYLRKRKRSDTNVYGYGLPAYAEGVITADSSLKGLSGYTYATAHAGPGPATLRQGAWLVDNLVTGSLAVNGPAYAGRMSIQQNDFTTVAFEVTAADATATSIAKFKDATGVVGFEITATGRPISRLTHYFTGPLQLGTTTADIGGGAGAIVSVKDATTVPVSNPTGGSLLYSQGGAMKMRTSGGSVVDLSAVSRNDLGVYVPPGWGSFWKAKRDAAKAGTGLATVAAVGSSSTQGLYASNLMTTSFAGRLKTALQSSYGDGGSGFFSTGNSATFFGAGASTTAWAAIPGNFCTTSGSWSIGNPYGPGANYLSTSTAGSSITFTLRGTTIRVYTMSGGGRVNWTYSVDGAAAVPVTDSGVVSIQVTTITGLSAGSHTLTLTHNGAGGSFFSPCGATGENATGVVLNNYGLSGAQTATFADLSQTYMPAAWSGGPNYPADLVIYALGANDANANVAADTLAANVRKFLSTVKDGTSSSGVKATGNTDVLILMQHIGSYDSTTYKWQDYTERVRGIAEAYGAAFVDIWPLGRNSWNYWQSLGFWGNSTTVGVAGTDTIHMSDAGHQYVANTLLPILTS
jgi:lysophospholipase L1-like esterase